MQSVKTLARLAAVPALLAAPLAFPASAGGQVPAVACPVWNGVQPDGGPGAALNSVAVLPSCEVLAVGSADHGAATLAMRFQAGAWTKLATPSPAGASSLLGVAATSAGNAWAVGQAIRPPVGNDSQATALILHWDGTSWTSVRAPQPAGASGSNDLAGVAASSAHNAWAVGHYGRPGGPKHTLIVHWNGTSWKRVLSPDPGGAARDNSLTGVVIISATDAWAVGWCQSGRFFRQTLILHWNGKAWRQLPGPAGTERNGLLFGVTATSPRDVWAVGYSIRLGPWKTLTMHWNGRRWRQEPSPNPVSPTVNTLIQLHSVTAASARNAWAVGFYRAPDGFWPALILHWDGRAWQVLHGPASGQENVSLFGVASASATAWAVGAIIGFRSIASQWNGQTWQPWPGQ